MSEQQIAFIKARQSEIEQLKQTQLIFLDFVKQNNNAYRLNSAFSVNDDGISTTCFGHVLKSQQKYFLSKDGQLAIEYAFYADNAGEELLIWSFVVHSDQKISFINATGDFERFRKIGIDAPNLAEELSIQLHAATFGSILFVRADRSEDHLG